MVRSDLSQLDLELLELKVKLKMGDGYAGSPLQVCQAMYSVPVVFGGMCKSDDEGQQVVAGVCGWSFGVCVSPETKRKGCPVRGRTLLLLPLTASRRACVVAHAGCCRATQAGAWQGAARQLAACSGLDAAGGGPEDTGRAHAAAAHAAADGGGQHPAA